MERTQTPTNNNPLLSSSLFNHSEWDHSLEVIIWSGSCYPMVQCSMPDHHKCMERVWCTWFSKVWIKSDREGCGAFIKISLQSIWIKSLSITIFHQDNYGHYCSKHQLHGKLDPAATRTQAAPCSAVPGKVLVFPCQPLNLDCCCSKRIQKMFPAISHQNKNRKIFFLSSFC